MSCAFSNHGVIRLQYRQKIGKKIKRSQERLSSLSNLSFRRAKGFSAVAPSLAGMTAKNRLITRLPGIRFPEVPYPAPRRSAASSPVSVEKHSFSTAPRASEKPPARCPVPFLKAAALKKSDQYPLNRYLQQTQGDNG
jgi:hypothetical protein